MTPKEIKAKLKEKKIKQVDICRAWNKPASTISMLVNRRMKSAALEKRLARKLGITVEELRALPTPAELIKRAEANLVELIKRFEQ